MSIRRIWAVTLKEIRHIFRDRATLSLVIFTPAILLIIMAYAVTSDINHVPLAIADLDRTPTSRAFIHQITLGSDLELVAQVDSFDAVEPLLLDNTAHIAVIIPPGFERDLLATRAMPLEVLIDGTEPETGGFAVERIAQRAETFALHALMENYTADASASLSPVQIETRAWYNPNLKSSVDIIPGLISMVLGVPGMTIALTLAREREHGTFEQLLATPIRRAELLLGKMGPYILAGVINVIITTLLATLWFKVPFQGSFSLFLGLSIVYFFALLSLGVIIGVFIRTQAAALALSMLAMFFPGFFLTGVFFPLVSMPPIARLEALILPGSHYAIVTRGVFITGIGISALWPYGLGLLALSFVFTGTAAVFFKKKLA
ncbi:MAG: ABC transporter permease [Anaerolineales bacterium]|nr:ABC transporter permease [Anaerolineales bacterium]